MGKDEKETVKTESIDVAEINGSNKGTTSEVEDKTSFLSLIKQPDYRKKVLHTLWIGWAFFMLGFILGQRGPSFLDLQLIANTDMKRGSAFFTASSVGYLLGSMLMGVLYDKFNKPLMMFFNILLMGVIAGSIPFCSPYVLMIGAFFLNGVSLGAVDTGGNADFIRVWGRGGRQYMQAIHFCYSFGGTISPLVTEPFLAPKDNEEAVPYNINNLTIVTTSSPSFNVSTFTSDLYATDLYGYVSNSTVTKITDVALVNETRVYIAYLIGGVMTVLASVPFLVMFFNHRSKTKKREPGVEEKTDNNLPKPLFALTIFLLCLCFLLYCAAEDTFASYLLSFTVKGLNWTKSQGSQITSAFWAAFAISRFCGIFFINCLSLAKLLSICLTCVVLSLLGFLLSSYFQFFLGIWIFAVSTGLSMSVIFPAAFTWAEDELLCVTGKVAAAILAASSAGTMINPLFMGYLMQQYTPMWYCYLLFADSIACMGTFLALLVLARTCIKRKRNATKITLTINVDDPSGQTNSLQHDVVSTRI